jgi:hypothetical protein
MKTLTSIFFALVLLAFFVVGAFTGGLVIDALYQEKCKLLLTKGHYDIEIRHACKLLTEDR